jgi:uncharacterized protein (DUF433 family)
MRATCEGRPIMQLEDYFTFFAPIDIRVKGTRVGIETILLDYLDGKLSAEEIAERYPSLTLEQVYATILYYLHNRERVDTYLETYLAESRRRQEEHDRNPSPAVLRMRELWARRDAYPTEEREEAWKRILVEERSRQAVQEKTV